MIDSTYQEIIRKGTFDSGHRVMNEKMKCFNIHGHTYLYELVFSFNTMKEIGYAIDFKEIKRVGGQWIDDMLDHGMILNPLDKEVLKAVMSTNSKLWIMSLNGKLEYCNPSVENIAKEIFLAMEFLFIQYQSLSINKVILHETPNCYTICYPNSISVDERKNFHDIRGGEIADYGFKKGIFEYDDRIV